MPDESENLRLDQCLARHVQPLSRRTAKLALDIGCVFLNERRVKTSSRRVRGGDRITAHLEGAFERALRGEAEAANELPLSILYEDPQLIGVMKPAGLLTAPTPEGDRNNLLYLLEQRSVPPHRHFVVHRLDLHTSGVLVFAKTKAANAALSELFKRHELTRQYDVFAHGQLAEARRVDEPVEGKHAVTHLRPLELFEHFSWLEATLETGRTHQIRKHLLGIGHPVLRDPKYGRRARAQSWLPPRLALHARRLSFVHPFTGQPLDIEASLPPDLGDWLAQFRGGHETRGADETQMLPDEPS